MVRVIYQGPAILEWPKLPIGTVHRHRLRAGSSRSARNRPSECLWRRSVHINFLLVGMRHSAHTSRWGHRLRVRPSRPCRRPLRAGRILTRLCARADLHQRLRGDRPVGHGPRPQPSKASRSGSSWRTRAPSRAAACMSSTYAPAMPPIGCASRAWSRSSTTSSPFPACGGRWRSASGPTRSGA